MKRILLALAVFASLQVANAQVKSAADAKKAVESAQAAANKRKHSNRLRGLSLEMSMLKLTRLLQETYGRVQADRNLLLSSAQ